MPETPEPSDQLPEEAPAGQVGEEKQDPGEGGPRSSPADRAPNEDADADVPEPREQATGNPDNAG